MTGIPHTSGQVPRGARPDAVKDNWPHLIKNVSRLRCTYQIRVLTALAEDAGQRLVVVVPKGTRLSRDLTQFIRDHKASIRVDRRTG
ncbi:hypothetical protein [Knoellia sp. LjRoot47]|uniref:hypothetical protein n=1 Tax=Knoellia sp. LjRoot47 TaxID=3342330 RepID=UPI003ECD805A